VAARPARQRAREAERRAPDGLQRDPFIFPANFVNREYFGDGSMRQTAPISPAIHLGADRILVVGCGFRPTEGERTVDHRYPSLAQIAGHAMASIFLDSLYTDLERLERINKTLQIIPTRSRSAAACRCARSRRW
jgi:NTE family protein